MKFSVAALSILGSLESARAFGTVGRSSHNNIGKALRSADQQYEGESNGYYYDQNFGAEEFENQSSMYEFSGEQFNEYSQYNEYSIGNEAQFAEGNLPPIPFGATKLEECDPNDFATYDAVTGAYQGQASPRFSFGNIFPGRDTQEASTTALHMTPATQMEIDALIGNIDDDTSQKPKMGDDSTITERMFKKIPEENQAGGAGASTTLDAFLRAEKNWERLKEFQAFQYDKKTLRWTQDTHGPPPQFVSTDGAFGNQKCWQKLRDSAGFNQLDYDVVVCGGTLGIFYATYLQLQGHRVCVVEAGKLRGREQEWNISMDELEELMRLNIITQADVDAVITTEFPACRSGFKNREVTPLEGGYFDNEETGYECLTPDVLNLGVTPSILIQRVADRFKEAGGVIKEETRLSGVCVSDLVGSAIDLGDREDPITAKLVLDCMGNASPISRQQRYGEKADGICCVVGSCASGYDKESNLFGDIIYTNQPITVTEENGANQYFWEAFPVGIGRNGNAPGTSDVKTTYSKCAPSVVFFLISMILW